MSTAIVARFHLNGHSLPPDEILNQMVRTVAQWPQANDGWQGLEVRKRNWHTVSTVKGPFSTDALCEAIRGRGAPDEQLSTTTSFRCWRFVGGQPKAGDVPAGAESWGTTWTALNHEDGRIGGEAAFVVYDVGPFCVLLDDALREHPHGEAVNTSVRENLDAFTGVLFRLIEALQPTSVKVFTEQGLYLPFNAHLAYYRNAEAILTDLSLIADVWERGLPKHGIAPLRQKKEADMSSAFHGWRNQTQREELWSNLDRVLPLRFAPTARAASEALRSGKLDTYDMQAGTTILDYPDFMNAFIDQFYLDALTNAHKSTD